MRRPIAVLIAVFALVIAGGAAFLATWEIPPPTHTIETVIPNDRFQR